MCVIFIFLYRKSQKGSQTIKFAGAFKRNTLYHYCPAALGSWSPAAGPAAPLHLQPTLRAVSLRMGDPGLLG